jgi:type IV pilus assembly protein PilP
MPYKRRKSSEVVRGLILIGFLLMLTGCGGGAPSAPVPAQGKAAPVEKKAVVAPKPAQKPELAAEKPGVAKKEEPEFTYDPAGKPDPFKPFIQLTLTKTGAKGVPLTPLQRYETSQLKLVAIIAAREGNVALVEDSAGKGYFLKKGTAVGKNDGTVTQILKDRVVIKEFEQDISGQTKQNEVLLYLHRPEEEGTEP